MKISERMGAGFLCLLLTACSPNYPKVSSGCYELGKSLATICNLKKSEQLAQLRKMAEDRHAQGHLSAQELALLDSIVKEAESGDWDDAQQRIRSLLSAQTVEVQPGLSAEQESNP